MKRVIFDEDHEAFRATIRQFFEREVLPNYADWIKQGFPDRDFFRRLGELGFLGMQVPEEFGGAGNESFKFNIVMIEEAMRLGLSLGTLRVHLDLVLPYLLRIANEDQKKRWLPGVASGDLVTAIAMTEPGTGSDLAGVRTSARRESDHYVLNGAKIFITGGFNADRILVVCRTSPPDGADRRRGISILVVDTKSDGFVVGRNLDKLGLKAQDTVELSFTDVEVPVEDLLGEEGRAWEYLTYNLAQERLTLAAQAVAMASTAVDLAQKYTTDRLIFGKPVASFQNTKFVLADCAVDVMAAQTFLDRAIDLNDKDELTPADAAAVKLFTTETAARVIDKCVQLHGGYGFMNEYQITRMYADSRVYRIYGGTSEVMRSVVAKSLGL